MDTRNRTVKTLFEILHLDFMASRSRSRSSLDDFLSEAHEILAKHFETSFLNSFQTYCHSRFKHLFPRISRPGNEISSSVRRKPLIVRVVRKASLALIFLTTLPLHPKNMWVMIHIFWFSADGRTSDEMSFLLEDFKYLRWIYVW